MVDLPAFPVDLAQLLDADLVQGIVLVDVDRQPVVPDQELLRVHAGFLGLVGLQRVHRAARVRDVARPVDERSDAYARAASRDFDREAGLDRGVGLGPRLREIDHGVRADVLEGGLLAGLGILLGGLLRAAERRESNGEHDSEPCDCAKRESECGHF